MGEIVVGYDGSAGSRAALDAAIELAKPLGESVTVVFGVGIPGIAGGEMTSHEDAIQERGQTVLQQATHQAQAKDAEVQVKMIDDHPAQALIAEAERADVRMIVVGNQGAPHPVAGALLGAVPFKLVHLSSVPVLVVPPS